MKNTLTGVIFGETREMFRPIVWLLVKHHVKGSTKTQHNIIVCKSATEGNTHRFLFFSKFVFWFKFSYLLQSFPHKQRKKDLLCCVNRVLHIPHLSEMVSCRLPHLTWINENNVHVFKNLGCASVRYKKLGKEEHLPQSVEFLSRREGPPFARSLYRRSLSEEYCNSIEEIAKAIKLLRFYD